MSSVGTKIYGGQFFPFPVEKTGTSLTAYNKIVDKLPVVVVQYVCKDLQQVNHRNRGAGIQVTIRWKNRSGWMRMENGVPAEGMEQLTRCIPEP